jgi:cell wall-associated NlpC family hydrolase
MKKSGISLVLVFAFLYACSFDYGNQASVATSDTIDNDSIVLRAVKTSGWASEGERVINAARQHAGQRPYGYSDGGWKKNSYDSSGQPIGEQLMYAAGPYLPSGWTAGLDCVGLVHVVFTETGHGSTGPYARIVAGRQSVPTMYNYYKNTTPRGCSFDSSLENRPGSTVSDANTNVGDIIIFKNPDGASPSSANLMHVGIYSGQGYMLNMTSVDVEETLVGKIQNRDGAYYSIAAVVHTGLSGIGPKQDFTPPPPLDLSHVQFDVTGYFTSGSGGVYFHPVLPVRLMDTRSSYNGTIFKSGQIQTFDAVQAMRLAGFPATATAVTGNLTVVKPSAAGYVSVAPGGMLTYRDPLPTINFSAGETRANGLTLLLFGGKMDILYVSNSGSGSANILFDITGYYSGDAGSTYIPVTPFRAMDSRRSSAFTSGAAKSFLLADWFSVNGLTRPPANVSAVTGNVTVTKPSEAGYVAVTPGGAIATGIYTSTVNFAKGATIANGVTIGLTDGKLEIIYNSSSGSGTTHVIFDVTGYFVNDASGSTYIPLLPNRALNTLQTGNASALKSGEVRSVPFLDFTNPTAVTGNVIAVQPMNAGYLTVGAGCALSFPPSISTVNFSGLDMKVNNVTVILQYGVIDFLYVATPRLVVR